MLQTVMSNLPMVATVLLAVSEGLALIFPSDTGFGGILAGFVKLLKALGAKEPSSK